MLALQTFVQTFIGDDRYCATTSPYIGDTTNLYGLQVG